MYVAQAWSLYQPDEIEPESLFHQFNFYDQESEVRESVEQA